MKPEGQTLKVNEITYQIAKIKTVAFTEIELQLNLIDESGNTKIVCLTKYFDRNYNDLDDLNHFDYYNLESMIKSEY